MQLARIDSKDRHPAGSLLRERYGDPAEIEAEAHPSCSVALCDTPALIRDEKTERLYCAAHAPRLRRVK